ncbi:MAG: DUF2786 domain-containing protein [Parvibaculum sedimenti]|uniref:DUF2786 domain-containing protein n=1 Tax=Parvibaculum sedimenti TaxID=2608632 RepID=UPI003BB5C169
MTKTKKPIAKELPLDKRRIAALLDKTEATGCTPGEAAAAFEKAEELVAKYEFDPAAFQWPPRPSTPFGSARSGPKPSKSPQTAASSRGRGIGRLAERLIVEHADWTYRRIAEEVNRRIEGAKASEKSVRWYASRMRQSGKQVPSRSKRPASAP